MKVRVYPMQRNIKRKFKNENLKTSYSFTKYGIFLLEYILKIMIINCMKI